MKNTFCALLTFLISASIGVAETNDIQRAMRDEIVRSMTELHLNGLQKPYYLEYRLSDAETHHIKASFGSLVESNTSKSKSLTVGIRVGTPEFDNTNFFDVGLSFFGSSDDEERFKGRRLPEELDYSSLRRSLWLATDAAYKQAAELYSKKQAAVKNRMRLDTIPDFSLLAPEIKADIRPIPAFDNKKFEALAVELSAVLRDFPEISLSTVAIEYLPKTTYFLNSESREYSRTEFFCGLEIVATTQATDGMPIAETYSAYSVNPEDLPSKDSLLNAVRILSQKLTESVHSPTMQAYSGPVLFEGQAAAEVFAQIFSPNLVTQRQPLTDQGFQDNARFAAFQNKIGGRVLPEFISLNVVPNKTAFGKTPLVGSYKFDEDGIDADTMSIVKNGYLKGLMSSRNPTKRVKKSNGHERGGAAMMSNLELMATKEKEQSSAELRAKMLKLCKDRELPFGIIIRKALNQNLLFTTLYQLTDGEFPFTRGESTIPLLEASKVFADGHEEPIRGCEAAGLSAQTFKDILAVGKQKFAYNYLAGAVTSPFVTGGAQFLPCSVIVPDILFEDVEVRPLEGDFAKPPILKHPYFTGK